jgi:superfamily II DNA or RNA helicase
MTTTDNKNHLRGYQYELQIKKYLIDNFPNNNVYLWKETPFRLLIESGVLISNIHNIDPNAINSFKDKGCDIFMHNNINNEYVIVQCKNYLDKNVCIADISGFSFMLLTISNVKGLIISNTDISNTIKEGIDRCDRLSHKIVKYQEINTILTEDNIIDSNNTLVPRQYQLDAYNNIKNINKCILQMPCGMGKTFIACMLAKNYNNIIILSPYRIFAEQLLAYFNSQLNGYDVFLIDSDGTRNINELKNNIGSKNIFSSTYKSADIVYELISNIDDVFVIVDEFHNLSSNNVLNKKDYMNKIIQLSDCDRLSKLLFMSATPKIYEVDDNKFNYEDLFGKIAYGYNFKDAIRNKYINDYQIIVPTNDNKYDKYEYIYYNLLYFGYKKCIIYAKNMDKAKKFVQKIIELNNNKFKIDIYIKTFTCDISYNIRQTILNKFKKNEQLSILVSVRILDECIDIPECDSVYFSCKCESQIRIIQRISRSLRIYKNKGKSGIFLYNDDKLINESLSEYGMNYIKKLTSIKSKILNDSAPSNDSNNILSINVNNEDVIELEKYNKINDPIFILDDLTNHDKILSINGNDEYEYIPSLFNKNDSTHFDQIKKIENKLHSDIDHILDFIKKTCAYISNAGKYIILTKTFKNNNIYYEAHKFFYGLRHIKLKYQYYKRIEKKDRKGNVKYVDKLKTCTKALNQILEEHKNKIFYKKIKFIPYATYEEFKKIYDSEVFNEFTGFVADIDPDLVIDYNLINPLLHLIKNVWCIGNDIYYNYILDWLAHLVQRPHTKIGVKIILKSTFESAEKNIFWDFFGNYVLGAPKYYLVINDLEKLTGQFNSVCACKILTICDEVGIYSHSPNGKLSKTKDKLKNITTQNIQIIERKGIDPIQVDDYNNFVVLTNNDYCVNIDLTDQKYFCLELDNDKACDRVYFKKIKDCYTFLHGTHFYNFLMRRDISEWNPTDIPKTEMKLNLILNSIDKPILFIMNLVDKNYDPSNNVRSSIDKLNFVSGNKIFTSDLFDVYVIWLKEEHNMSNFLNSKRFSEILNSKIKLKSQHIRNGNDVRKGFLIDVDAIRSNIGKFLKNSNLNFDATYNSTSILSMDIHDSKKSKYYNDTNIDDINEISKDIINKISSPTSIESTKTIKSDKILFTIDSSMDESDRYAISYEDISNHDTSINDFYVNEISDSSIIDDKSTNDCYVYDTSNNSTIDDKSTNDCYIYDTSKNNTIGNKLINKKLKCKLFSSYQIIKLDHFDD